MSHYPSFFIEAHLDGGLLNGDIIGAEYFRSDLKKHLKSRRIARNEKVEFLNGSGLRIIAQCEDPQTFRYRILEIKKEAEIVPYIELCLPLIKQDLLSEALSQATEIGVSRIRWIRSEHDQVPKGLKKIPFERAERIAQAAIEQCARPWTISIDHDWTDISSLLENSEYEKVVADENLANKNFLGFSTEQSLEISKKVLLFIGPEGGWSQNERQAFDSAKVHFLSLGNLVLRVPTAIVSAVFFLRLRNS